MQNKNIIFKIRFLIVAILTAASLLACSGSDTVQDAQIALTFRDFNGSMVNKLGARAVSGAAEGITRISISVYNAAEVKIAGGDMTASSSTLRLKVPAFAPLNVVADAFAETELKYHGATKVEPLKPGTNNYVSFLLYGVDEQLLEPVQIDIGLQNKPANAPSVGDTLSFNSRFALFRSAASNLVSNDQNQKTDIFLKDLISGKVINLHSTDTGVIANTQFNSLELRADMSADGRYVVFSSDANGLVSDDTNNLTDIFLKNTANGAISLVSRATNGDAPLKPSRFPGISNDGRFIVFASEAELVEAGKSGIYRYDRLADELALLIPGGRRPVLADDGNHVVYESSEDGGIAVFDVAGNQSKKIVDGQSGASNIFSYATNFNARFVVFAPKIKIGGFAAFHVYRHEVETGETKQVSADADGVALVSYVNADRAPTISNDGRFVAFQFNQSVYVKNMVNNELALLAQGQMPVIGGSGEHVGYSSLPEGRLFRAANPLYSALATGAATGPRAPALVTLNPLGETLVLQWDNENNADENVYYRVYVAEHTYPWGADAGSRRNEVAYETTALPSADAPFEIPFPFQLNQHYVISVTVVSGQGESERSAPIRLLYEGVKPITESQTFFYPPDAEIINGKVRARDPFGDAVTYALTSQPTTGEIISFSEDGSFVYAAPLGTRGKAYFSFVASDGVYTSTPGQATINFNDVPVVRDQTFQASSNNEFTGLLQATDEDRQRLTYVEVGAESDFPTYFGTLVLGNDGSFSYTPAAEDLDTNGDISFSYRAFDGYEYSDIATVSLEFVISESCLATKAAILSTAFNLAQYQSTVLVHDQTESVAGLVLERAANVNEISALDIVSGIEHTFASSAANVASFNKIGQKLGEDDHNIVTEYVLNLFSPVGTIDLINAIATESGAVSPLDQLPLPGGNGLVSNKYRAIVSVDYLPQQTVVASLVVVADSEYALHSDLLTGFNDGGNIAFCGGSIKTQTDVFTAEDQTQNIADFLFVIDNSGSMGSYQTALRLAAEEFTNVVQSSGLDFNVGVITTDTQDLQGSGFTNDLPTIENDVMVGTSGSGTETGIWYAEQTLLSTVQGDGDNGSVTNAGYPRQGASLSVIMISDEPDQYAARSNGLSFDPFDNLFIERGYRVYAIVNENDAAGSLYDELALATDGSVASINDTTSFAAIMQNIALDAGGAVSAYVTSVRPISSTLRVSVNGNLVPRSFIDGWQYLPASQSIVFYGNAIPPAGASVEVSYNWLYFKPSAPVAHDKALVSENLQAVEGKLTAHDFNIEDTLSFEIWSTPSNGSVTINSDGSFVYTPDSVSLPAMDSFLFVVSDGTYYSNAATVQIELRENLPPVTPGETLQVYDFDERSGYLIATDQENDPLTYALVTSPASGYASIDPDGYYYYYNYGDMTGNDSFTYSVSDGVNPPVVSTVAIELLGTRPQAYYSGHAVAQNTPLAGQLTARAGALPLIYSLNAPPSLGSASVATDGSFTYTPALDFVGVETFGFEISDGVSNSFAYVTVVVSPAAPIVFDDFESGGFTAQAWTALPSEDWTVASGDSGLMAQMIPGVSGQTPSLEVPITVGSAAGAASVPGAIVFESKLESSYEYAYAELLVLDATTMQQVAYDITYGAYPWRSQVVDLMPGDYILQWHFPNGGTDIDGFWLDNVRVLPAVTAP